jgi:broad specificity phosphatase PhoE
VASKRSFITLSLIRCGEGRLLGSANLPLAEAGRPALAADADRLAGLRLGSIHHPPDEAATETAKIFARTVKARAKAVEELADPNLGLLEGLLTREFADRHAKRYHQWKDDPLALIPPEGEPIAEARTRLFAAVARLLKRSRAGEVAVVLHPLGLGLLRCWLADRPPSHLWPMLEDDRRVERYTFAMSLIDRLRVPDAAEAAGPRNGP